MCIALLLLICCTHWRWLWVEIVMVETDVSQPKAKNVPEQMGFYRREVTPSNLCVRPFGRHNRYLDYSSSEVLEYSPEVPVWHESTHLRYQRVSRGLN